MGNSVVRNHVLAAGKNPNVAGSLKNLKTDRGSKRVHLLP
jgi:hypothetical protein